eukprot:scaffold3998_cov232-Ochromonas_danica.AAC.3
MDAYLREWFPKRQDYEGGHWEGIETSAFLCYLCLVFCLAVLSFLHSMYYSYPSFHRDCRRALCGHNPSDVAKNGTAGRALSRRRLNFPYTPISSSPRRDDYLTAQHDARSQHDEKA